MAVIDKIDWFFKGFTFLTAVIAAAVGPDVTTHIAWACVAGWVLCSMLQKAYSVSLERDIEEWRDLVHLMRDDNEDIAAENTELRSEVSKLRRMLYSKKNNNASPEPEA